MKVKLLVICFWLLFFDASYATLEQRYKDDIDNGQKKQIEKMTKSIESHCKTEATVN